MTTPVFKLTKGARNFDLQTGRYRVYGGWAPPPVSEIPLFAEGTSANRGGAVLVDRRPVNRQMSLRLNVLGSSDAEIRRAVADLQMMLSLAGDEYEPLYLEFRPNSDTPEPLWGNYGSNLRYEIVHGAAEIEQTYLVGARLATDTDVVLTLAVKPYALGRPQQLGSVLGGVVEQVIGEPSGASRGLTVAEATTNKMTNPVFGSATWSTGWTTDAGLTSSQGVDPAYGFGVSYAVLAAGTGGTWRFYQSINVGNTNTHVLSCYARRPDGAAITSSDVKLYYNADLTTTFTAVGNGVYRLTASASGINASTVTGVDLQAGGVLLAVWGFQLEEKSYVTELATGDMLGCAWSGTAHGSTSARTAARWRIVDTKILPRGTGAMRLVWTPHLGATTYAAVCMLLDSTANNWRVYFNNSDDKFYFADGTVTLTSAAQTFIAGSKQVLHMVFTRGEMTLYINGAQAATNVGYTAPATGGYIYLGCNSSTAQHANGTLTGLAAWDNALTAAQVLADYTNIAQLTGDDQSVGTIPWLWVKDGDDVVDNCDDSTREHWGVAGGIPGGTAAETEIELQSSTTFSPAAAGGIIMSNMITDRFVEPTALGLYTDLSGSVDANSSGGAYESQAVTTSTTTYTSGIDLTRAMAEALAGQECYAVARLNDQTAAALQIRFSYQYGLDNNAASEWRAITSAAYFLMRLTGSIIIPDIRRALDRSGFPTTSGIYFGARRSTGTGNVYVDFFHLVTRPLMVLRSTSTNAGNIFIYRSREAELKNYSSSTGQFTTDAVEMAGDIVRLVPGKYNHLTTFTGDPYTATAEITITRTLTYNRLIVTPRYPLL